MRHRALLLVALVSIVPATPAAAIECSRNCATECSRIDDPNLLLPDLITLPPGHARNTPRGGHRVLLFTSSPGNIGDGPLIVHGKTVQTPTGPVTMAIQEIWKRDGTSCTHSAGTFAYHPSHHHFHIGDFASYQLRKDNPFTGPIVAESTKVSFCLLDIDRLRGFRLPRQVVSDCLNQEGTQGISVGYADVYDFFLPDQLIDLDSDPAHPVPGGAYFLVNVVNPDGLLWEKDDSPESNTGFVSVGVTAPRRVRSRTAAQPGGSVPAHDPNPPFLGPRPRIPHQPHSPTH